ncbi:MAG TPA: recombination protein O N-terminal domain-containing protein, partial [Azospirillaceae bacterium]|nr:recombination protein O N-terminal domain-containing protein [Azospirillaceae bacterium]
MEWSDDAVVLSARAYGETAALVAVLARDHGRPRGQQDRGKHLPRLLFR